MTQRRQMQSRLKDGRRRFFLPGVGIDARQLLRGRSGQRIAELESRAKASGGVEPNGAFGQRAE